jgi:hypothetical protein
LRERQKGEVMLVYKLLFRGHDGKMLGPISIKEWDTSGEWMPDVGRPVHCISGYYGLDRKQLERYMDMGCDASRHPDEYDLYIIEIEGEVNYSDKYAGSRARIVKHLGPITEFLRECKLLQTFPCGCMPECNFLTYYFDCGNYVYMERGQTRCDRIHFDIDKIPELNSED